MHIGDCSKLWVHRIGLLGVMAAVGIAGACSSEAPPPQPAAETAAPAAPAESHAAAHPRVFFVQPQEGATVKSPVHFEFGLENFTLAPVPPGTVEMAREHMGHHHLGVDTDCLPVGEIIPKADPWVHFGDGKTIIDMQLKPGPHKFALQVGDDMHRTLEGLCQTISVTVVE